jgi:hypothetical protein
MWRTYTRMCAYTCTIKQTHKNIFISLDSIELVSDYSKIGRGQGGYREDVMFYGIGAGI